MEKLSNTDTELKNSVAYKKACISLNALSQSDCRVFKSTIYPEQVAEIALFYAY